MLFRSLDSAQTPAAAQQTNAANAAIPDKDTNISNVLSHLQKLEEHNKSLEAKLLAADDRIQSLSAEKRAGMKSALDTFIKNWVNANEADETVKEKFFQGVESLAEKADEGNGVWKMMVAASNLHARQEHDLDKLRTENTDLKQRVDGMYGTSESRTGESVPVWTEATEWMARRRPTTRPIKSPHATAFGRTLRRAWRSFKVSKFRVQRVPVVQVYTVRALVRQIGRAHV